MYICMYGIYTIDDIKYIILNVVYSMYAIHMYIHLHNVQVQHMPHCTLYHCLVHMSYKKKCALQSN